MCRWRSVRSRSLVLQAPFRSTTPSVSCRWTSSTRRSTLGAPSSLKHEKMNPFLIKTFSRSTCSSTFGLSSLQLCQASGWSTESSPSSHTRWDLAQFYSLHPFFLEIWQKTNDMRQRNIKSMMWKIDTMYMFLMLQMIADESERDPRKGRSSSEQGCHPRLSHQGWPQVALIIVMYFIITCVGKCLYPL